MRLVCSGESRELARYLSSCRRTSWSFVRRSSGCAQSVTSRRSGEGLSTGDRVEPKWWRGDSRPSCRDQTPVCQTPELVAQSIQLRIEARSRPSGRRGKTPRTGHDGRHFRRGGVRGQAPHHLHTLTPRLRGAKRRSAEEAGRLPCNAYVAKKEQLEKRKEGRVTELLAAVELGPGPRQERGRRGDRRGDRAAWRTVGM